MSVSPVPGPSRPRQPDSTSDLAARVVALQRKHVAALGPGRGPSRRLEDEFDRGPTPVRQDSRTLYDPSRASFGLGPPVESPRLMPTPHPGQQALSVHSEDRHRRGGQHHPPRSPVPPTRSGESGKKLFNPEVHDPMQFAARSVSGSEPRSEPGPSRMRRPNGHFRSPEEEADRERERRRRREGSERGAMSATTGSSKRRETDGKSKGSRSSDGSESLKDRERGKGKGDTGVKAILKDIHNRIRSIEQELTEIHRRLAQDPDLRLAAILLAGKQESASKREDDNSAWMELIVRHKELAELHHDFLTRVFDPLIPASFQQLAVKYNIPSRLWQTSFHLILERLRHAWMSKHPTALDLLTDMVYDSYKFYTELLEDQALVSFRFAWIEALGDLARYRMAIASHLSQENTLNTHGVRSPPPAGRPDTDDDGEPVSSGASIGKEVADQWDVEDKETWRTTARDWYTMGITEKPGEGRLHHHLALLCRDQRGQEGRALHHFTKSLVVTHEFATSRESILPLFDAALQSQRSLPEASAMDLFVRLHGMLFTKIQLDDFVPVMSRFMERLEEDASLDGHSRKASIAQVDWMLMASSNLAAVMQYGSSGGVVRRALAEEGNERRRLQSAATEEVQADDVDPEMEDEVAPAQAQQDRAPSPPESADAPHPLAYTYALQLAFTMLDFTLAHPNRMQGIHTVLNPYITIFVTFIATLFRQPPPAAVLLPAIPWKSLVQFISLAHLQLREESRLLNGPPLPEDWMVRGMEWVGRRTFERGFWKPKGSGRGSGAIAQPRIGERFQSEIDVLLANFDSALDISEGVVDEVDGADLTDGPVAVNQRRWRRIAWATGILLKQVDGLELRDGGVVICGQLKSKLDEVDAEKQRESMEERRRLARRQPIFEDEEEELVDEIDGGDFDPELAALRQRKQQLSSLLHQPDARASRSAKKAIRKAPNAVPGYTMLVFDTNALLQHLSLFSMIVEGGQWSVIVPLPVVTELDGLAKSPEVGMAAVQAISYLEDRMRTHSLCLKIQTSKGNYLSDLLVRTEDHHSHSHHTHPPGAKDKTMDDRILSIAAFQLDNFVDRSRLLGGSRAPAGASKVLLVTFDRNLRLKARARGVDAADEHDLQAILGPL